MNDAKALMTAAAEAALRGDADAVQKAEAALAELSRNQHQHDRSTARNDHDAGESPTC